MSKKLNEKFMSAYIELDSVCGEKFNVANGGVTEYINRLNNARVAPGRDDALPKLVRYRTIRNVIAHEVGSVKKDNGIGKADIAWLAKFAKDVKKKTDPISLYLRKARRYVRFRKIRKIFTTVGILLLLAVVAAICIVIFK